MTTVRRITCGGCPCRRLCRRSEAAGGETTGDVLLYFRIVFYCVVSVMSVLYDCV